MDLKPGQEIRYITKFFGFTRRAKFIKWERRLFSYCGEPDTEIYYLIMLKGKRVKWIHSCYVFEDK